MMQNVQKRRSTGWIKTKSDPKLLMILTSDPVLMYQYQSQVKQSMRLSAAISLSFAHFGLVALKYPYVGTFGR